MSPIPYRDLPRHCFWRQSVAEAGPLDLDPVAAVPFVIAPDDRIATAGSCFAQHIAGQLRAYGLQFLETEMAHPYINREEALNYNYGIYTARYGNIYTARQLLQLFQRAYGRFVPAEDIWYEGGSHIDPFRPRIQPDGFATREEFYADRAQHFAAVRQAFESLDVFVFTLGLTERWESRIDGAVFPLCPGVAGGTYAPDRHRMLNAGVAEVVADMLAFIELLRGVNPRARLVLTVSPVPLAATARADTHVLAASTYSKSVLRVACEELAARCPNVAYMPAFEIITSTHSRGRYFSSDLRSVNEAGVAHVMRVFLRHFTASAAPAAVLVPVASALGETKATHLQDMQRLVAVNCDEDALVPYGAVQPHRELERDTCNLCGGRDFGAGPNGRLSVSGQPPHCRSCGALERGRALMSVLASVLYHDARWQSMLVHGADHRLDAAAFAHGIHTLAGDANKANAQLADLAAGSHDCISLTYFFEFQRDDSGAFDAVLRAMPMHGMLQVCFIDPHLRDKTVAVSGAGGRYHAYGANVFAHLGGSTHGLAAIEVTAVDPVTDTLQPLHFFFKDAAHPILALLARRHRGACRRLDMVS